MRTHTAIGSAFAYLTALLNNAVLFVTGSVIMAPFVWMLSLSAKSPQEIFARRSTLWPQDLSVIDNYREALTATPLARYMANGLIVCSAILLLQIMICAPCAYAVAKLRFPGRDLAFGAVLIALLLPHQVLSLPLFVLAHSLGILDTYVALIFPYLVSPFGIFLFRQFFKSVPDDLVHAARLDGLSEFSIVWRIMVPVALPAVIAFSIFSVVSHWNDLFWPLIAVRDQALMPPSLGVLAFKNEETGSAYGPLMAASTIIVAPLLLAFLIAQRWFVEGLAAGAIK
ncbi:carbohydrate ABC transporter permease [Rhizobium calliandrae]|uniref:Carbohydrate ABC transporter permease n=1 Tax=Rhizobium calliandrae TaxID=1312182 RepID=A0ABT7KIZ6_9HYPH|nr:carbohydrate ABC transporter permease [Rhizobium calliandrae]MDL2408598.1 carbohydrate ABC transporter permease [Rhizobium calliandrae]